MTGVSSFIRPSIEDVVFRDVDGRVIDYGDRWQGSPPEDTYSVDTHPERFAPLHIVAEALIAHLRDTYEVEIDEGAEVADDLVRPAFHDVVRAVRVRPDGETCASVTLVLTAYPGVYMHAGLLHDFHYPICGCDACDSTWQAEADELERHVFAIVAGHYRETVERARDPWMEYAFTFPDGAASGRSRARDLPAERLAAARPVLDRLPGEWAPWPHAS